ncbi:gamma-glutamyltransferase [Dictyobacter arantiisoli]|uniref:Gamma-glutamyltransferase n=1 Tax=Dictyobacter arantiisoli TaxID=2014874 RepID=A0A5A5THH7_9CHLR|nr:gamma-glutamyltransferase [Dictyobacter arantiisoli]GCF11030.1 gamma-glutamyltransferase [Dictyobacter arantiisoli]
MPSLNPAHWDQEQLTTLMKNTPTGTQKTAHTSHEAIATHHPLSTWAGLQALQLGGSAADAIVTMLALDTVLQPGISTLAGSLSLIYHESVSGQTYALNAGFNRPLNDDMTYDPQLHQTTGRAVLVPGIVAGLEMLWHRFGILPWADLWRPAIYFAREGFILNDAYFHTIQRRQKVLLRSAEGCAIFAPTGELPTRESLFQQPQLTETLKKVALRGTTYFYRGDWARQFVNTIQRHGGNMRLEDMQLYQPRWDTPLVGHYLNYELRTVPPPHYGGAALCYELAIAEALGLHQLSSRAVSAQTLHEEMQICKLAMQTSELKQDLHNATKAEQAAFRHVLSQAQVSRRATSILNHDIQLESTSDNDGQAHHLAAIDRAGNFISAIHSLEGPPWGETGLFVEGVALNSGANRIYDRLPAPGARISEPMTTYLVLQNGKPYFAAAASGVGQQLCALQHTMNLLTHTMSLSQTVSQPRQGYPLQNNEEMRERTDYCYWTAVGLDTQTGRPTAVIDLRLAENASSDS